MYNIMLITTLQRSGDGVRQSDGRTAADEGQILSQWDWTSASKSPQPAISPVNDNNRLSIDEY